MTLRHSALALSFAALLCQQTSSANAQSWGWPPVSPNTPLPSAPPLSLGSEIFSPAPFVPGEYQPEKNLPLPVRFQEDPLGASSPEGYQNSEFSHIYLQSIGLCRYFAWSDLFSWLRFHRTGERRFFSPTFFYSGFTPGTNYARHIEDHLTHVPGGLLREDDNIWIQGPRTWPRYAESLKERIQPEVTLANLRFVLYSNPQIEERQLVIRNTDRTVPVIDDAGVVISRWGVAVTQNPNPSAYEQMNWETVLNVREHLVRYKMPLVAMYFEPGGRTFVPYKGPWSNHWERYDRTWSHAVLVLGFDDNMILQDMNKYELNQERREGFPLVHQTEFWPPRGAFLIRDSFSGETTHISYAKFLRLGIFAEGLVPKP